MTDWSGATWVKGTRSNASGNCVELTKVGDAYGIRDSKDPNGPVLEFTPAEWEAFRLGAKAGEFDSL